MLEKFTRKVARKIINNPTDCFIVSVPRGIVLRIDFSKKLKRENIFIDRETTETLSVPCRDENEIKDSVIDILKNFKGGDSGLSLFCVLTYAVSKKRKKISGDEVDFKPEIFTGKLLCEKFRLKADFRTGISKDPVLWICGNDGITLKFRRIKRVVTPYHFDRNTDTDFHFRFISVLQSVIRNHFPHKSFGKEIIYNKTRIVYPLVKGKYACNLPFGFLMIRAGDRNYLINKDEW